jgi:hypothetical protein
VLRPSLCVLLPLIASTRAGAYHRCDDGSGVPIYQTEPCAPGVRSVARYEYVEPAPPAARTDAPRASRGRESRAGSGRSTAGGRASPAARATLGYECTLGTAQWLQAEPCRATADDARAPKQRALPRTELCTRLRDASLRTAPGSRTSDATYQHNRLRDRGNC